MKSLRNLQANLKRLRKAQGLTQEALAEKAGLEYKYFQKIESGRWPGLQLSTIERLAKALRVEAWELLQTPK
jgi:transcriptional regulator with XRE-family HTH domain